MITKEGFNNLNEHKWVVYYPQMVMEPGVMHSAAGIVVVATELGLMIGGELIGWGELEIAKREAQKISHLEIVR